jgi:hypothetical protein
VSELRKYPRTRHVEGSRLQPGDQDLEQVSFRELAGRHLVVEEKLDGANSALSFDAEGRLLLQSRGHYLRGGATEQQFALFKNWAHARAPELHARLGSRYVVYGEWLHAKHTVFYDALPHYFLEFDVLDREEDVFLSTPARRALLSGLPIVSVPVLHEGTVATRAVLEGFVRPSLYKSAGWRDALADAARAAGLDPWAVARETDRDDRSEGLYLKREQEGRVVDRFKFIRAGFHQTVLDSGSHWMDRPPIANRLAPGVDPFA